MYRTRTKRSRGHSVNPPTRRPDRSTTIDEAFGIMEKAKRAARREERTIRGYKTDVCKYFVDWLQANGHSTVVSQITPDIIRDYMNWMSYEKKQYSGHPYKTEADKCKLGLSPRTVNIRIRSLKVFFNFCAKERIIQLSPMANIPLQTVDDDDITPFTPTQVKLLLSQPDTDTFVGFRDRVIMLVMLDTGIRAKELLNMRYKHFNPLDNTLTVPAENAKTGKTRILPLSPRTSGALQELIDENEYFGSKSDFIFCNARGGRLAEASFDDRLKVYGAAANLLDKVRVSSHTFRHTFAVTWIKNGGDPFSLQKILGHSDLTMVRRYVNLCAADVKDQHQKYSPVNIIFEDEKE